MNADSTLDRHEHDIQAILATGFGRLRRSRYCLLRIIDAPRARAWIGDRVVGGLVRSVASLGRDARLVDGPGGASGATSPPADLTDANRADALTLAFTFGGLCKLGLREAENLPFPAVFKRGMADPERAGLFGDTPAAWAWGDRPVGGGAAGGGAGGGDGIDILAAYCSVDDGLPGFLEEAALRASGLQLAFSIKGCPAYIDENGEAYEPFGFRDGIAQPVVRGLRESARVKAARRSAGPLFADRVVAPGEFVLGHLNEYGERAQCPDLAGAPQDAQPFGFNGSYMVVRQIAQHVAAFVAWEKGIGDPQAAGAGGAPASPGEKLIGRRRSGESLLCPFTRAAPHEADPPKDLDAFRYRVEDAVGFLCPRGAHVRRANPRDLLGWDVASGVAAAKLHRLLRRGRVIGQSKCAAEGAPACGAAASRRHDGDPCGAAMMFVALNADLERQYEFVQQQWIMNPRFGDLAGERDPIAAGGGDQRLFSVPQDPVGKKYPLGQEDFTQVLGGGYFFLPSLTALRRIGAGAAAPG